MARVVAAATTRPRRAVLARARRRGGTRRCRRRLRHCLPPGGAVRLVRRRLRHRPVQGHSDQSQAGCVAPNGAPPLRPPSDVSAVTVGDLRSARPFVLNSPEFLDDLDPRPPARCASSARQPASCVLTLALPERRNAMTEELTAAWAEQVAQLRADRSVRAVVVTGEGTAFCAGGDLSWIEAGGAEVDALRTKMRAFYLTWLSIRDLEVPVLAAVNGPGDRRRALPRAGLRPALRVADRPLRGTVRRARHASRDGGVVPAARGGRDAAGAGDALHRPDLRGRGGGGGRPDQRGAAGGDAGRRGGGDRREGGRRWRRWRCG